MMDKVANKLDEAYNDHIMNECEKLDTMNDSQKWKAISRILNHEHVSTVQPIKVGNDYLFEDEQILTEMEKYHIHKPPPPPLSKEEEEHLSEWKRKAKESDNESIMDVPISDHEVEGTFSTCSGASGSDGVSKKLIDNADRESMSKILQFIWNEAWMKGVFPKEWKKEHRAVLPKPGKETYNKCSSYRTVSLTSIVGKRFEKITSNRLKTYLDSIDFDVNQYAYLNGRSTTHALLTLTETLKKSILNNKIAGVVFFDFTDAFGNVNRNKLVKKLWEKFNIRGKLFLHLCDFLSDRKARIKVNSVLGEWQESSSGISAVLGALLFIMHVFDAPPPIKPKYADDFTAVAISDSVSKVEKMLQASVDELVKWCDENDMILN